MSNLTNNKYVEDTLDTLKASEKTYRALFESKLDGTLVTDADGTLLLANRAAAEMFGFTSVDEMLQADRADGTRPDESAVITAITRDLSDNKASQAREFRLMNSTGEEKWVSAVATQTDYQGNGARIISLRDITDRKKAQAELEQTMAALKRSNADLQAFAYITSHDLQEPLRMVSSYVQLLARRYEGKLDKDADEFIGFAVDGANRMQRMINDLLAYSRVGTHGKEFQPTNCEDTLKQALDNLQLVIEESGASLTHDPLPTILADESQMIQLFQNLIGNAIKFRSTEPPKIHIATRCNSTEWVFRVTDNGIGIDPDNFDRIFQVFQRLHSGEYAGTGIGLAICKKVVERHGGRTWVESEVGKGSSFYFTIPCMEGELS